MQAVEDGQRHGHGHTVERMVRLEAVGKFELAVCGLPEFWELLFGNVRGGVLHQIVAAEEQQARIVALGGFEPGFKGTDISKGQWFQTAFAFCGMLIGLVV